MRPSESSFRVKRKVIAMTTEEKLQHFTTYAMEEARNKSDAMIREYTDAMRKILRSIRRRSVVRRSLRSRPRPIVWYVRITSSSPRNRLKSREP